MLMKKNPDSGATNSAHTPAWLNRRMRLCSLSCLMLWSVLGASGCAVEQTDEFPGAQTGMLDLPTMKEPSGICFHPARKTLYIVDDGGDICEATLDGRVLNQRHVRDADFEGITVDPASGMLYVAIEGEESILEVHPVTLQEKREFFIPRIWRGATVMKKGGQGIEDIAYVRDSANVQGGTFFVSNQNMSLDDPEDLSAVFQVELPLRRPYAAPDSGRLLRYFLPYATDIAALYFDAESRLLFLVSDAEDRLFAFRLDGTRRGSWPLPGREQEGFTVDADGNAYIAQDTGGVMTLRLDWRALRMHR